MPRTAASPQLTASGSIAVKRQRAQVARPSRIWVEGVHDADLLEKIWGDDLRSVGVVVEPMHGADDLASEVRRFGPSATQRLAILLDHYVEGSKEWRIGQAVRSEHVLVVGHPFVDVWAAVRPQVVGLDAWPEVPLGENWKSGICRRVARPGAEPPEPGRFWREVLARVNTWTDLDTSFINSVERMIDFCTIEDSIPVGSDES